MKLVFCGTPEFAVPSLEAVLAAGHEVALVLTQPDRPAGRKMELQIPVVKLAALAHSLPVMRSIISRLVGKAGVAGRKIFFSIPAPCPDGDQAIAYHEASIQQILKQLGFEPQPIQEGLAVVFGEMAASNYTGIGISC